ncbi:Ig-like domain repeat protein [Rhizobium sp. CFBP 13644]|nr:Ig-like domain repeat protein [Rhizobium sp. CFBP 13644]
MGESVTFTATLSNGSAPSGNVTFKDGTNTIGTGTISISGTTATYTTTSLTAGSHSITAEYGGDTNNAAATSAAIAVTVAAPTFTFSTAGGALSSARVGSRYDQTVTANASGITAPISYSVKTGALPSGLTLNTASGEISGTPTTAGTYSFTIEASDNAAPPNSGSATYGITVSPATNFVFSPAGGPLPEAMAGEEYSQPISATGGVGATTYGIPTGSPPLPAGLVLNVSTGELAGSLDANTEGDYSFTIEARDNTGATATASYTLHVAARAVTVDDKTVTVSAGSAPNNVNLASGATGGPFDSAEIISNTQSNAGTFAIVNGEFAQASGPTPTGWYMKFTPNPAFSGRVSVGFRLTSTLGVSNTGTITYNIAYDPAEVAYEIDTLVYGFVQTRQNLISSTIKVPGLLERRQMARATAPVTTRMTPSAQGITLGFSTSLAQMEAARDNSDGIVSDEQLPFNVWIDGTFLAHNRKDNGDKWGNFAMVSAGADYLLSPGALIGLSFHFDHMTDPTKEDATLTGNGWFVGPNASLEIGKGIFWDTSLLYGGSANNIDTQFWDGSFDTTRWMFDTSISGQWALDDVTTLTPRLRALYFSETAEDYSVTNSDGDVLTIEGFTQDQLRVSLGAELARHFTLEKDRILTPKIGFTGGVTDRDSNRAFGQLSAGLSLDTADNWSLDAGLLFNFSADDEKSLGVKAGISGKF